MQFAFQKRVEISIAVFAFADEYARAVFSHLLFLHLVVARRQVHFDALREPDHLVVSKLSNTRRSIFDLVEINRVVG